MYYLVKLNMPMTFNILHKEAHVRLFTICDSKILETTGRIIGQKVNEMWYFYAMKPVEK